MGLIIGVVAVIAAILVLVNATAITTRFLHLKADDSSQRVILNVLLVVGIAMLVWGGYVMVLTIRDLG